MIGTMDALLADRGDALRKLLASSAAQFDAEARDLGFTTLGQRLKLKNALLAMDTGSATDLQVPRAPPQLASEQAAAASLASAPPAVKDLLEDIDSEDDADEGIQLPAPPKGTGPLPSTGGPL